MTDERIEDYVFTILLLSMGFFMHGDTVKEISSIALEFIQEKQVIQEECRTELEILEEVTKISGVIEAEVSYEKYLGCRLYYKINEDVISYVHYPGTRLMRVNTYFNGRSENCSDSVANTHERVEVDRTSQCQGDDNLGIIDHLRYSREDSVADVVVFYIENILLPNIVVR